MGNLYTGSVDQYVTRWALGTEKTPEDLEASGRGYRFEKNGARTFLYHNGAEMRFLGYIEFVPGKTRGDHYHVRKVEHMCVIKGTIRAKFFPCDSPENVIETILAAGDVVKIIPGCVHSYLSDEGAVAVEFSPQRFELADTIDIDVKWN